MLDVYTLYIFIYIYILYIYIYVCVCVCMYIYGIHFELRFFDSIEKVGPSGIRNHDLVHIVHTL